MDKKPSGNGGRPRGRGGNQQVGANGRGRRQPQSGPNDGAGTPSAWGPPPNGGGRGNRGPSQAWPQMSGGTQPTAATVQQERAAAAPPPAASAWGPPLGSSDRGSKKNAGAPQPTAAAQPAGSWRTAQPSNPPQSTNTAPPQQQRIVTQPAAAAPQQRQPPSAAAPQQRPPPSAVAPQQRPPEAAFVRSTSRDAAPSSVAKEDARGAVRGRRVIADVVHSRPQNLPTKSGLTGNKVIATTNYYRILKKPNWSIYQYRIDFSPDIELVRLRRAYLSHHKELFGGYIFDGTVLFCTKYIGENGPIEVLTKNREGEIIQIKIKHVGIVDATDVQQIQVLNLILRRAMEGLNLQLVGRNFFDPLAKIKMESYNLELWPGYQTSIRQHERDILLCAEITHKVMRTENLYQILMKCTSIPRSDYQMLFKKEVVGTVVLTDYNNKTYRVDDVDFEKSPMSTFKTKDSEISFLEYYKQRYNLKIRDPKQPMLLSRPTEKNIRGGQNDFIMLIPELCRATGLTDELRNNFRLMKAMGDHTRIYPDKRIERLRTFNNRLYASKASMDVFTQWNMQLDKNLVELPGRVLPPEKIVFGNQKKVQCDANADWTREFRNTTMYSHIDIKRWYVIVPERQVREVQEFVKMCIRAAASMKMHIAEPRYEEMRDDRTGSYARSIDNVVANDPQILLIVMFNNNEEKYSCIKKKCCVDRPVPSQVVTLRTIAPRGDKAAGLMSVATKVVIQMNAKLMGAPWMIDLPLTGLMTVGFDVCHSAKEKNKSYGALVATMDLRKSSRYFSAVTEHLKGQELSNEISMNLTCALKAYRAVHGTLPERILFYRDGVGDGQLHQVFNTEVKYLKKRLDEIYISAGIAAGCRLAFIIVSKRINTRYFVNRQNPVPGTVIDDIITLPERYDFYLVSQSVRQGTVSPTSYNVIHDNMGLSADKLQMLTYKMTHLYYNWSGTLRVPAVCQYAHKLAFLVAESIHRAPNNALENQLYFL